MAVRADPRLGQGDPTGNGTAALASELFQQHSPLVLAVCRRLLVDPAEAEDAMQQTFLHAYRSLLAGREPQQPSAWLSSIARNECLNRIRARTREPGADQLANGAVGSPDALNAAIASEDLRALGHTIKGLPAQQREALLLHEFCGLRYEEVAAAIGVSESAIGSLLFRARSRLRFVLQRAYGLLPIPWLWDFARAPAVKVVALPAVAKVGTAAVAVSLATGTAVAVEREVEAPKRPAPPPARVSPAPAVSSSVLRPTAIAETITESSARSSSPTLAPSRTRTNAGTPSAARTAHRARPVRAATAGTSEDQPEPASSHAPPAPPGPGRPGASNSSSVHGRTAGSSTRGAAHTRAESSAAKSAKPKKSGEQTPSKVSRQRPSSAARGNPNGNAQLANPSSGNPGGGPSQPQQGNGSGNAEADAGQAADRGTKHKGDGTQTHKEH